MKLLRHLAAWLDRKAERSAVVEECEPRILYSADAAPWMWSGTAEVRLVDDPALDGQSAAAREQSGAQSGSTVQVAQRTEIVFIDSRVADRQALIDDLMARSDGHTRFELVIVDRASDGLAQIDAALAGRSGIDALHIVSHGDDGVLLLGSRTFDATALQGRADELASWQSALSDDADILLYGCDVAAGEGGQALLGTLAQLTRADIAASTDTTGAASRGGNWVLEAQSGQIETSIAFSAELQFSWQAGLATYVVSNTNDSGAGSLRQAITDANNNPGADIIAFNIAGTGPHTISLASALPTITGSVVIDGWTEPDYSAANPTPAITIDGNATGGTIGINIAASDVTIRGLNIQRFDTAGIYIQSGSNNTIQGNFIGTNAAGTALAEAVGAMSDGIQVRGSNNLIGGSTAQTRNIIAGTQDGIRLTTAAATGNVIQGNYIGTDITATLNLGVSDDAVDIGGGAAGNTVGGTGAGQGNVIAYSGDEGVEFRADAGSNNGAAGNSFFGNASQAINDLNTPLAAPALTTASSSGGSTTIQGTLTSTPSTTFRVDFYATPSLFADAAGGEGRRYLGSATVTTNGAGTVTISATLAVAVNNGDRISATATNTSGKTSEFSANVTAAGAVNEIVVDTVSDVADGTTSSITNLLNARGADGLISLREAITAANATPGIDTIRFAIPGYGTHTINVASALPQITEAVVIDGSTEPDYAGTPVVRIDGAAAGFSGISIGATGGGSTVRGLMITGFTVDGINVASGANNVTIDRNWIGTAGTGTTGIGNSGVGNSDDGIDIAGSGATITNNVITNSGDEGITIVGSGVLNHVIQGNIIGLDPDGASGAGNADVGIAIISGTNVTIGGTAAGQRNVISNNWEGMEINTANNTIQGNYIGTDSTGTLNRGNRIGDGIQIQGAASNTVVGGTAAGAGNLIAYNAGHGVDIVSGSGHQVIGNVIDTNAKAGVYTDTTAAGNTIGGTAAGSGNVVRNNGWDGIRLNGSGTGNSFLGNSIYSNTEQAIDIGTQGVTTNDAGDGDTGGNNLQNFPVLTSARTDGAGQLIVAGSLNSTANSQFRIEFFANSAQDGSGYGEGQRYLGFVNVTTDGAGNVTFSATLGATVAVGEFISAIATQSNAGFTAYTDSSELARNVGAVSMSQATLTVDTANDTVDGDTTSISTLLASKGADGFVSLREAIIAANNTANGTSADRITFNIAGGGVQTINPSSALPTITDAVTIDGTTQPGASANSATTGNNAVLLIELNGTAAGSSNGLTFGAGSDGSTVRGLIINRFALSGIQLSSTNNLIAGNWIGLDSAGALDRGNAVDGVTVSANGNTIGGVAAADRNVISGNDDEGIDVDPGIGATVIRGNYVGTNVAGTAAVGNGQAAAGNWGGILIDGDSNTVGGTNAGEGNLISGNFQWGLYVNGSGNVVQGNLVGTDAAGTGSLGNVGAGVLVNSTFGGNNNRVGGVAAGAGNTIAFNTGVGISNSGGTGNAFLGNRISSNGSLGIDLGANGVTANDAGDADTGANNLQNFPALTGAVSSGGNTTITGTFHSTASTTFRIEFFSAPTADASGYGEGQTYLGFATVVTDASGNATINTTLTGVAVTAGHVVSATATVDLGGGSYGSTSEFSAAVTCGGAPINTVPGPQTVNEDTALAIGGVSVSDPDGNLSTVRLTVGNGTVNVSLAGGASISAGANSSATLTLSGSQAQINAALATLTYQGASNYNGADTLTVLSTDALGATDSDGVNIAVNAVNDPPVLGSASLTVSEGQTVTLAPANFGITDPDSASFTYTVSGISGGYFQLSSAAGTPITTFTTAQLAGGLVQFVDDGNEVAPAFSVTVNDGTANSNTLAATITYTPVNDPPVLVSAGLTVGEGQTVTLAPANFGVTDPDSASFTYTVSGISGGYFQLSSAAGTPITTFTTAQLAGGLVQFIDDGNEVAPAFSVTVNDGAANSNTLAATISYTPVNDAPVLASAALTVSEGQTVTLAPANFGITDPDSATFTYTVSGISGGYFQLSSAPGTPITTFTTAQLSGGLVQFVDDGNEVAPAFSVTVSDGTANSNTLAATITYTPVNDPPVLTAGAPDVTFVEGGMAQVIDALFTVSDVDSANFAGGTLTVSITANGSAADRLQVGNFGTGAGQVGVSGTNVTYGGVAIGSFTGGTDGSTPLVVTFNVNATAAAVQEVARSIQFDNVSDTPSTLSRQVSFTLTDGDGGTATPQVETVFVQATNDAPVFTVPPGTTAYTEGATVFVTPSATLTDADSPDFNGGQLVISITAGGETTDRLYVNSQGTGPGQVFASGANVFYNGGSGSVLVGTISGGYGTSDPLVITFNGNSTPAAAAAITSQVLFWNTSDNPAASSRTVTLQVTDGDGGTSQLQTRTIGVTPINDAPAIAGLSGDSVAYSEGAGAIVIEQGGNATVTDVDSMDFDTGMLTVSFAAGSDSAEDVLGIRNEGTGAGQIGVSGTNVMYGGVTIGTFTGGSGGADLVVTFNANSSAVAVQALVRNVTFTDTDTVAPTTGNRTIRFVLTDGDGGSSGSHDATVTVSAVNTAPVLTSANLALSEGQTVTLAPANFGIIDPDSSSFTYTLSGISGGYFQLSSAAGTPITSFTTAQLSGGLVQFVDDGNEVAPAFSVAVNDGAANSNTLAATITYTPVNDPPVLASAALTVTEGQTVTLSGANFGISDSDSSSFTYTVSGISGGYFQLSSAAGTPITSFTTAQLSAGQVQFVDDGDEVAPAFGVTVNDGASSSNTLAVSITFNPVNDPPVLTSAALTVNEGQTVTLAPASFGIADPDSANFTYTVGGIAGGYFQLSSAAGTPITNFTSAQLGAGLVQFVDDGDEVSPSFDVTVNDGSAGSNTLGATITFNPTNDPPLLTSAALTLSEGQTVTLAPANFGIADPDNSSFAYTVSGVSGGYFQLSSAAGTPITSFTTAQLSGGLVQFVDNGDEVAPAFSVTVNDGTANSNTLAATITYTPVNDPPLVSSAALTLSEGQTVPLAPANFGITDPDSSSFTYTLSGVSGGYFQLSSAPGTPVTTFTTAQLSGGLVQFVDDGDEVAPAFSVTVNDGAANSNTLAATITYTPVNDPPVLTSAALTLSEGQTVTLSAANFGITDPDNSSFAYTVSGVSGGYFQLTTAAGTPITSFTTAQLGAGLVQFVDDGNELAPAFSVTVNDGAANSNTLAVSITFNPVNDPPTLTSAALTVNEGQTVTLAPASFGITDPDNASFTYTVSGISGGYFQVITAAGTPITSFTSAQLGAGQVQFVDDGDEVAPAFNVTVNDGSANSNTLAASITYTPQNDAPVLTSAALTVSEGQTVTLAPSDFGITDPDSSSFTYTVSGISGGYFQLSSAAGTPITGFTSAQLGAGLVQFVDDGDEVAPGFSVTVNDGASSSNTLAASITFNLVNDPPVLTSAALTVSESQTVTLSAANFGISDPDSSSFTYTVSGTAGGYFQLSSATGTPITNFTSAQLGAGLVQFVDDGNEVAPAFSVTVNDGSVDSNTLAAMITYTPANDVPSLTSAALTVSEGQTVTLGGANFGITDPDSASFTYTVSGVAGGYFQLSSAVATPITSFTTAQLSGGLVQFVDDGNEVGPAFSVTINDGVADSNTLAASITYNAVNDPPVLTSATLTVNEGQIVTLAPANFGISDPDSAGFTYTMSGVAGGYFQLSSAAGTPVTSFTTAQLSAGQVQFVDDGDEVAPAFSVTVNDGAANSNTLAATITYTPVNDPPTLTSAALTLSEGQTVTLGPADFGISDPDNVSFTYTVSGISGGYFQLSGAAGTPITIFTSAQLGAGQVQFVDDGDEVAPGFSVKVNDGTLDSNTLAANVAYNPVNDAPVAAPVTLAPLPEDGGLRRITQADLLAGASDADGGTLTATGLAIAAGGGALVDNGDGTWSYTPAANDDTTVQFSYRVDDGQGGMAAGVATLDLLPVNDAPAITSDGGGATASLSVAENANAVTTVTASDVDLPSQPLAFAVVGGADASRFAIDPVTGALRFVTAPDHEAPADADGDNVYDVVVQASDGRLATTQDVAVLVTNVNEAPTALTPASAQLNFGAAAGAAVATLAATDPDPADTMRFTLIDDAGGRFSVDATTGAVSVASGVRLDDPAATQFQLVVRVTDAGGLSLDRPFVVSLQGVAPQAPTPASPLPPTPAAPPEPAPEVAAPAALLPAPVSAGGGLEQRGLRSQGEVGTAAEAVSAAQTPSAADEVRRTLPRVQLTLRSRDDGEGVAASVSFAVAGGGDIHTVALSWEEIGSRSLEAAWRGLTSAMHRSFSIDTDDDALQPARDDSRPADVIAMLQDPIRVASVTFAAGFVWWLTRSGGLLTTMLLGIPAWRHVDLLPVLARRLDDEDDDDDESSRREEPTRPDELDDPALAALFDRVRAAGGEARRAT